MPRFETPRSLDDLPDEILTSIYGHYWAGCKIVALTCDAQSLVSRKPLSDILRLNKKHSAIAYEAMKQHATLQFSDAAGVATVLCHGRDVSGLRSVSLKLFGYGHLAQEYFPFVLMDDIFRYLRSIREVHFELHTRHYCGHSDSDTIMADTERYISDAIQKDEPWTRRMLESALPFGQSPTNNWFNDILRGDAFAGLDQSPDIYVNVHLVLTGKGGTPFGEQNFSYCLRSCRLTANLCGKLVSVKQAYSASFQPLDRHDRGLLCDQSSVENKIQDTLRQALGRDLDPNLVVSIAKFESMGNAKIRESMRDVIADLLHGQSMFALDHVSYLKIVQWLEHELKPKRGLNTAEEMEELLEVIDSRCKRFCKRDMVDRESIELAWKLRQVAGPPRNVLDAYDIVKSALSAKHELGCRELNIISRICWGRVYGKEWGY